MFRKTGVVLALMAFGCATTMTPRANTREEVVAYVDRAAALYEREGVAACDTLKKPSWYSGEWYVFALELNGAIVCQPAAPQLVGTMVADVKDPSGKAIGMEFSSVASGPEKSGWVDYVWPRPGHPDPVAKSSYVRAVTGPDGKTYIVGSGAYELP